MKRHFASQIFKLSLLVALVAGLLLQAACAAAPEPSMDAPAPESNADAMVQESNARPQLTGFTANDIEGNAVTEAVFTNAKVTVLNVWATFCGPCLNEMPDLGELSKEYADKGLQIVGLVSDVGDSADDVAAVQKIVEQTGANYTHILPSQDLVDQLLSSVMYVPTTLFFDENGYQIGEMVVGSNDKESWKELFDAALAEANAQQTETPAA